MVLAELLVQAVKLVLLVHPVQAVVQELLVQVVNPVQVEVLELQVLQELLV